MPQSAGAGVPSQSCGVPLNPMAHTGGGQQTSDDMVSPLKMPSRVGGYSMVNEGGIECNLIP